ncbi:MAG: NTP transferase domain-containing protein [Rectinemataceae bacterium]
MIPAAGASSRMGAWKPLLAWGESTIIETVISSVLGAGLSAIVVAGHRGAELHALLDGHDRVRVVDNPAWEAGMAGSVARGAECLCPAAAFLVLPADMPLVGSIIIRKLLETHAGEYTDTVFFAAFRGRPGHPVVVPVGLVPAISALSPKARIRDLLMAGPHRLVETGDPAVLADLDSAADYATFLPVHTVRTM